MFGNSGPLGELLQTIDDHMKFMNEQEENVDKFISKQGSADLLRAAKDKSLETEKKLMQQIMNFSEINTFLNNIILIENLFNLFYTKQQKMKQENARKQYVSNIEKYERKPKPVSDVNSFMELMFAGTNLHKASFEKWLKKVDGECKKKKVNMISNSGAKGKNIERAFYKSFYVYSVTHGDDGFKQMTDVLRCSLVFDDFDDLYRCFGIIEKLAKENKNGGILRCKDRFNPSQVPFGYRDLLINMYCPGSKIVCEIQLHHTLFYKQKKISNTMYKKARLFQEEDENMAYKYANENIRKVIGDKIYELSEDDLKYGDDDEDNLKYSDEYDETLFDKHLCEMAADELFEKWRLTDYTDSFIKEEGFDEPELWKDLTMNELKQDHGFKKGHAKKFIRFVQGLEEKRTEFEEIKKKREIIKKQFLQKKAKKPKIPTKEELKEDNNDWQKDDAVQIKTDPSKKTSDTTKYVTSSPKPQPVPPELSEPLPDDWSAQLDPKKGKVYYINSITKTTQWEKPENIKIATSKSPQQQTQQQPQPNIKYVDQNGNPVASPTQQQVIQTQPQQNIKSVDTTKNDDDVTVNSNNNGCCQIM